MLVAELTDERVKFSIFLEFSTIPGVGLILFGDYSEFLLQVGGEAKAARAKGLSADVIDIFGVAVGANLLFDGVPVDHCENDYYKS